MPSEVEEIEAILREHMASARGAHAPGPYHLVNIPQAAAAIAAFRSQDRGAREMRERAAAAAECSYSTINIDVFWFSGQKAQNPQGESRFLSVKEAERLAQERVAAIRALPLSPVRTEDGRDA